MDDNLFVYFNFRKIIKTCFTHLQHFHRCQDSMINAFYFGNSSIANRSKVQVTQKELKIDYPCTDSSVCTYVSFLLPKGTYFFQIAGASSAIDSRLYNGLLSQVDSPQAGGLVSGTIKLTKSTNIFVHVGGKGKTYEPSLILEGGYNGGGGADNERNPGSLGTSGGGSTDIRTEINDVWHRILVAGGGGGSDDHGSNLSANDGIGGAGGGLISQSFTVSYKYQEGYEANQTSGFSFFQGERGTTQKSSHPNGYQIYTTISEQPGAGGGWFGGFSSHNHNGGASGGSSFALTLDAEIPPGSIPLYDENYTFIESHPYAYTPSTSPYLFEAVVHQRGIWAGNGYVHITLLKPGSQFCTCINRIKFVPSFFFVIYLLK